MCEKREFDTSSLLPGDKKTAEEFRQLLLFSFIPLIS